MRHFGEMAEWSNAPVLKTGEGHTSGGSNPSFSAKGNPQRKLWVFCFHEQAKFTLAWEWKQKTNYALAYLMFLCLYWIAYWG